MTCLTADHFVASTKMVLARYRFAISHSCNLFAGHAFTHLSVISHPRRRVCTPYRRERGKAVG